MPNVSSSKRYAQAIFEIALEQNNVDSWVESLTVVDSVLDSESVEILDAPQISKSQKYKLIKDSFKKIDHQVAINLVCLLASRCLVYILKDIIVELNIVKDKHDNVSRPLVVSAVKLDQKQLDDIKVMSQGLFGGQIILDTEVDPNIIGGLILKVDDTVLDGSVTKKLQNMKKEIV
ncbi:MAG: ATP synthase F1 subunit delta [SAR202 cluster bacterium]|nr:ATP synthase F1 subunit delta [SAR202 cluster bacterium]|tara:strand:+ start:32502 stop:33029 length:528 start_codon:yes stop_codon:yes gene_type:complete